MCLAHMVFKMDVITDIYYKLNLTQKMAVPVYIYITCQEPPWTENVAYEDSQRHGQSTRGEALSMNISLVIPREHEPTGCRLAAGRHNLQSANVC